jgi:predicted RNA-binding Zn ribbon-like protein
MHTRPLTGEPLPLDLLNTQWNSQVGPVDALDSHQDLAAFLSLYGLDSAHLELAASSLRASRDAIRALVSGQAAPMNAFLRRFSLQVQLQDGAAQISPCASTPQVTLAHQAAWQGIQLIKETPHRVRCCAHPSCVLWFLDTTRSGTRRWCSMATCGNRLKAKRHQARQRDA